MNYNSKGEKLALIPLRGDRRANRAGQVRGYFDIVDAVQNAGQTLHVRMKLPCRNVALEDLPKFQAVSG